MVKEVVCSIYNIFVGYLLLCIFETVQNRQRLLLLFSLFNEQVQQLSPGQYLWLTLSEIQRYLQCHRSACI